MAHFVPDGNVDVVDFLECLEIRNVSVRGDNAQFSCPFPGHSNGDDNPSASMNVHTTAFRCYGCKEKGNAIHFAAHVLSCSPLEAIRMLKQRYQPGGINPDAVSMVEEVRKILDATQEDEKEQPILDESLLERYAVDWRAAYEGWLAHEGHPATDYLFGRGFLPEHLDAWEFGYDPNTDRITFAVRDELGRLIGFKARAYDGRQPKYLVMGDAPNKPPRDGFPRYFPSKVVFGAHKLTQDSELVVCEGEFNAIAVNARTGRPAVALNGSHFSERHARLIRRFASRVILFLDSDKAGREATWGRLDTNGLYHPGIVHHLKNFVPVLITPDSEKDAADLNGSEIEDLLSNAESALLRTLANA